jgi:hypothetical protein
MSVEKCPMSEAYGFYWQSDSIERSIPDVCQRICESLWNAAILEQRAEIDLMHDCDSFNLSYEDTSLQGGPQSAQRSISILTNCDEHGEDAFSESYTFTCLNK